MSFAGTIEVALSLSGFMYNYLQERWGRLSRVLAPAYRVVTFLIIFLSVCEVSFVFSLCGKGSAVGGSSGSSPG